MLIIVICSGGHLLSNDILWWEFNACRWRATLTNSSQSQKKSNNQEWLFDHRFLLWGSVRQGWVGEDVHSRPGTTRMETEKSWHTSHVMAAIRVYLQMSSGTHTILLLIWIITSYFLLRLQQNTSCTFTISTIYGLVEPPSPGCVSVLSLGIQTANSHHKWPTVWQW